MKVLGIKPDGIINFLSNEAPWQIMQGLQDTPRLASGSLIILLLFLGFSAAGAQERRPSVALVLGGGGARGFAHVAVLELIEELGIPVDMIAGVSSGAIIGGLYAAGYSPAMILETLDNRDWSSFFQDRPVSPFWTKNEELPLAFSLSDSAGPIIPNWGKGYSSGQKAYEFFKSLTVKIPSYVDFDNLPIPFRAGVVEVPEGKFELLDCGDLAEAIRASMSIQGIFEPFIIDGRSYVDGGLLNNLPVREVRKLGFDIVIAVNLFTIPQEFSTAPTDLPDLMNTIYSYGMSKDQGELADVVLFPLLSNISAMDFSKGPEIYALAKGEREKLLMLLEPVRQKITAGEHQSSLIHPEGYNGSRQAYNDMPYLIPQRIIQNGVLPQDRSFIEKMFSHHLLGKALNRDNAVAFLEIVYETGNYRMAAIRTDLRHGETYLELMLYPETENKILLRAGLDFEGTFSSQSSGKTALRSGLELRSRNGFSLLLQASVMDELSAGLSVFQPLGPYFFLAAETDLVRDQKILVKGILSREEIVPERLLYFHGAVKGGLRINRQNSLSLWPEYYWFTDDDRTYTMTGIAAAYTYTSLDHSLFPSRGFRVRIENRIRFTPDDKEPFDLVSIDLAAPVPIGSRFSLVTSCFALSLFGRTGLPPEIAVFNLGNVQRHYFPHNPEKFSGKKKTALSLTLQAEPRENLSLLGGRLIFLLSASAGCAGSFEWNDLINFGKDNLVWNASLGTALVPVRNFGIQIRAGAGGGRQPAPFISLDVGLKGFQKRLF
ncbi:MAG: patatin-like phospholipase family protein [Treponema sp.]|nr:patatin-like phospholipase family protein [Treponema sp.]